MAAGDLDGDGKAELVVGTGGLVPAVAVFAGQTMKTLLFPFGMSGSGVNVA